MKICNYPVCGVAWAEEIDEQEIRHSFWICDCCGCEYGYDDNSKYREPWINQGARPLDWSLEEQLKHILVDWNA